MTKKISDFIEVKNPRVSGRYSKQKVAIGHFVEDYIAEKIDINIGMFELLSHRSEIFTYDYTNHHYYFFLSRMIPEVVIHSKKQDERIIRSHYDNKNDLFNWFLGPKMIYTSCYFKDESETLEEAQENKMDLIAQKMQLKPGERLLDIGCGWGTLVAHQAKHYGVDATGVTIAQAGADWANQQIKDFGVEDRARILVKDYRDIPRDRKFDKISCLEMAEHVGIKYFKTFMQQCYDMLEDDGIFYLQIAGLRERNHLFSVPDREDLVWGLFMNEYIFSGADASMPLNWDLRRIEKVGFEVHSVENIGNHYHITIKRWHENWLGNKDKVLEKYGERIFRIYEIFLAWSVLITKIGGSSAYQIVCHKNRDDFDRLKFIGDINLGESDGFKKSREMEVARS
ncbi:cyclopropane-fatty-acyl-phospholipid synthase family protein [Reichenbachiella sp. MALMAid0571]|uniref:cyclopropane-fatty-acyl-phospholipid synthase family protein n=1 Tax=Reichenbachiella sp. MALMAid0571 TaxID=3143939 RepID=UPI0032DF149E